MATFEKRSGKIRVKITVNGQRVAKTFDNVADAKLWAISAKHDIPETKEDTKYSPPTFCDVLAQYETLVTPLKRNPQNELVMIGRLKTECWVNMRLTQLTVGHLSEYKRQRLCEIKASSLHRYFDIIRHAAQIAQDEWDWNVDAAMFRQVKIKIPPTTAIKRVHDDVIQTLIATANDYSRVQWLVPVIEFAVATGLRRKEIADLTWDDIDFDRRMIVVSQTKTMYPRRIPITSAIEKILMAVFPAKFNPHSLVFRASVDSIRNAFRRVRDRAGLTVNFHDLRHEAVSSLFEIGLTPIEVASISGHRTLKSLMRYSHADTQNLLKKMEGELA
jgi:integrase